ncbi:MAG: hypothetical protein LBP39_00305 [Rickettsiales bacterium]|jgi:hypothetical protein|nr:hypothetical protein [Rickettsiales bacterium]
MKKNNRLTIISVFAISLVIYIQNKAIASPAIDKLCAFESKPLGNKNSERRTAEITVVQQDPDEPIEPLEDSMARGLASSLYGSKNYVNIYLDKYSNLNFAIKNGSINFNNSIIGARPTEKREREEKDDDTSTITVSPGEGWFNIGEGALIKSLNFVNLGNISLHSNVAVLDLEDFRNTGVIRFEIFPECDGCGKIKAKNIVLDPGTLLEVTAARGIYNSGMVYRVMNSEEKEIIGKENVSVIFSSGLQARGEFYDGGRGYQIVIEKDSDMDIDSDGEL